MIQNGKFIFYIFIFIVCIKRSVAQNDPYQVNKNIGLCNLYSDSLTYDQLKDCTHITINSEKKIAVTSYIFSYYMTDELLMLHSVQGFSNEIAKEEIEKMIKTKPKTLYLTEIVGECESEILILGQRKIFIK